MKFLIAGLGSIGRRHLRSLIALGETDIVLYRTHQSTLPDDELRDFPAYSDLDEALSQKPDAVIVSNPTALHMDVAVPAARAGCSLLLEKPISDTLVRIADLQQALVCGGGKVLVGFQFRYHPGLRKIKNFLEEAVVGQPICICVHWGEYLPGWHQWEDYRQGYAARADLGGGVVRTLCHPFDYLRWLFGELGSVSATVSNSGLLGIEVEDTAEVGLQFSSSVVGSVHLNYLQRPARHDLEIVASQGTIRWDNATGGVEVYRADSSQAWQSYSVPEGFERNHLFMSQMSHFIELLQGKVTPICTLEDGVMVQRIVETVYQAAQDKKFVPIQ
jgi:predicted dehydrogenase